MTPAAFTQWMTRNNFTNKDAANALGISVSAVCDLRQGVARATGKIRPIDRRTVLACMAVDAGLHKSDSDVMPHQKALQDVKAATKFLKNSK